MSEYRYIKGRHHDVFEASRHDSDPKGYVLLSIKDDDAYGSGFFNSDQLMAIARLCTELAQEVEDAD